jgi:hypothetical protein
MGWYVGEMGMMGIQSFAPRIYGAAFDSNSSGKVSAPVWSGPSS